MIIREFYGSGVAAFRAFLARARKRPRAAVPWKLLEDDKHSRVVYPRIEAKPTSFNRRADAAKYFTDLLSPLPEHEVANNAGLWTWLTLLFFDDVCPVQKGQRRVRNDYSYVFESKNARHYYRHLLFIAWKVQSIAPEHNRLFLNNPVASLDKITTEVMKRLYVTRIPCIFEVLDRLYWDEETGKARRGIVSPSTVKPGDLMHRLPIRIRQLEKTYDLLTLSADQMLELLGEEFRPNGK